MALNMVVWGQADSATGPALQAAFLAMQDFGGKMLLFQNAVPSLGEHRRSALPQLGYSTAADPPTAPWQQGF
jgi:hypothetical protein